MLTKSSRWMFAIACFSMMGATSVYAQRVEVQAVDPPPAAQRVEVRASDASAGDAFRAKQVLGGKVSIEGDTSIGRVDDIVFDQDGYVEYLIVENQGKLVTVPWEAARFNYKERSAMVNITPDQFREIPTYTVDRYPVFTAPTYRTDTYRYYGLTPRERRVERRIDRRN